MYEIPPKNILDHFITFFQISHTISIRDLEIVL